MKKRILNMLVVMALVLGVASVTHLARPEDWRGEAWDWYRSPFGAENSGVAVEQEKAALKAKIDAKDPKYDRAKAEKSRADIFNLYIKSLQTGNGYGLLYDDRTTWWFPTPAEFIKKYQAAVAGFSASTPSAGPSSTPAPSARPSSGPVPSTGSSSTGQPSVSSPAGQNWLKLDWNDGTSIVTMEDIDWAPSVKNLIRMAVEVDGDHGNGTQPVSWLDENGEPVEFADTSVRRDSAENTAWLEKYCGQTITAQWD